MADLNYNSGLPWILDSLLQRSKKNNQRDDIISSSKNQ